MSLRKRRRRSVWRAKIIPSSWSAWSTATWRTAHRSLTKRIAKKTCSKNVSPKTPSNGSPGSSRKAASAKKSFRISKMPHALTLKRRYASRMLRRILPKKIYSPTFMPERIIKFNDSIREATEQMMEKDSSVFILGLGIPNGMGGTTTGLKAKYPERVLETPTSEAALTGLAVGAAISGLHPIVHYDRVEFSLLAADQIFTQAAKWNYMFGGGNNVPIVFRIIVGRQWGNGPQHSQAFYSLYGAARG